MGPGQKYVREALKNYSLEPCPFKELIGKFQGHLSAENNSTAVRFSDVV